MADLLTLMRKTQEAQAVRLGIQVERQFTDDELAGSMDLLAEAEAELYGTDPRNEGVPLSGIERQKLSELNRRLIPFRVTITTTTGSDEVNVLATDACMANMRAAEILFPDLDCEKPMAFKIKVEPVNVVQLKEAA